MKKIFNFLFISPDNISLLVSADARRRKTLNAMLMAMSVTVICLLAIILSLYVILPGKISNGDLISICTGCLIALAGFALVAFLNRRISSRAAGIILLLISYVVIVSADTPYEIVYGRSLIFVAVPVVIAAILFPSRGGAVVAFINSVVISYVAVSYYGLPNFPAIWVLFFVALLIWQSTSMLERALEQVQISNQSLLEAEEQVSRINVKLEQRVAARTAELQTANDQLQAEMIERKQAEVAMRESEWRNRIVAELTTDYIFVVDVEPDGVLKLRWASDNMLRMTGRTVDDAATSAIWENIIHPDDSVRFLGYVNKILSTAESGECECRTFHKQGGERWIRIFARPQVDEGNHVTSIVGAIRDITERKRMDDTLRESEARYRAVVEDQTELICRFLPEGTLTFVNDAYCNYFGIKRDDLMGRSFMPLIPAEDQDIVLQNAISVSPESPVVVYEHRVILSNGELRWQQWTDRALYDGTGQIREFQSVGRDITDRKNAEETLRMAEADYRTIFERAPVGIFRSTVDGRFVKVNHVMAKMYGYPSPEEMIAYVKSISEQMYTEQMLREEFVRLLAEHGEVLGFESRDRRKDDSIFWTSMNARAVKNADGEILYYEGFIIDITEKKWIEMELLESEVRTRAMLQAIPDLMFRTDGQGVFLDYKADVRSLYTQPETVIGKRYRDIAPPEFADLIDRQTRMTLETGTLQTFEYRLPVPARGVREYEARMTVSGIDEVTTIVRDVTERKRAEMERKVLLEIMQGLISTNDLREFLELIRQSINKVIPAENYSVVLYDRETELFEEIYAIDKYDAPMLPSKLEKSITAYVFRTDESLLLNRENFDELAAHGEVELVGTDSACWLGVPLRVSSETFGVIAIQDYENPNCYSERDKDFLTFIGAQVAMAIERKRAEEDLSAAKESLSRANVVLQQALEREQRVSRTDSLTDAHNRRYFFEFADHEFAVTKRYEKSLSMIMFDIDHFKQFNDMYGHQAGDEILKHVTQIAAQQLRDADILARYGGEEFAILLPNSNAQESFIVAERIRESINSFQMDINGNKVNITISVGVTECLAFTVTLDQLIQQADRAMYAAKDAGRNCVQIYSAP